MTAKRNTPEGDRLDVLVTLVDAWESSPDPPTRRAELALFCVEQAPAPGIVGLGPTQVTSARRESTRGDPRQWWADCPAQIGRALIVSMALMVAE
jgi:hypothetical protein